MGARVNNYVKVFRDSGNEAVLSEDFCATKTICKNACCFVYKCVSAQRVSRRRCQISKIAQASVRPSYVYAYTCTFLYFPHLACLNSLLILLSVRYHAAIRYASDPSDFVNCHISSLSADKRALFSSMRLFPAAIQFCEIFL